MGKVGSRVATYVWQVIAVDGDGHGRGTCGHAHASAAEAVSCTWAPPGWDEMLVCDLLVRKVRDRRGETGATRRRSRAA